MASRPTRGATSFRSAASSTRWSPDGAPSAAGNIRSLAVLPLANLSGDPKEDYFADGMTEELITDLSKISNLRVTSRTSIMGLKNTKKKIPEVARDLGVSFVVEGSVVRDG